MKKLFKGLLAAAVTLSVATPTVLAQENEFAGETVTVGVMAGFEEEEWQVVVDKAAEEDLTVELVIFDDYIQPNIALRDGSLDLNAFQGAAFLEEWNESNDADLQPIGFTYVSPMAAFSEKVASLDELEDGAEIGIPNDPINGGRALLALEIAGLIEVDDEAGSTPTVSDITSNKKNLEIVELEAPQLAISLADVDAAFINTGFVTDAGLDVLEDSIFIDAEYPEQLQTDYKNVIATRPDEVDNPLYNHIVDLYQTEEMAQAIYDATSGADRAIWDGAPVIESPSEE